MKQFLKDIFAPIESSDQASDATIQKQVQIATAALLIEIATIDNEFSDEEKQSINNILTRHFNLSSEEVEEVISATKDELADRIDTYYFTNLINDNFDKPTKLKIIEMIWDVIYADDHLDAHEDYLVHRFAKLLRLEHSEMIDAKLKAKKAKKAKEAEK